MTLTYHCRECDAEMELDFSFEERASDLTHCHECMAELNQKRIEAAVDEIVIDRSVSLRVD
jgi:predicted nucleic acid-binding Zn ribbon protein